MGNYYKKIFQKNISNERIDIIEQLKVKNVFKNLIMYNWSEKYTLNSKM